MTDITTNDLQDLLLYFSKSTYRAKDADSTVKFIYQLLFILNLIIYLNRVY